jgi:hypothetical protein
MTPWHLLLAIALLIASCVGSFCIHRLYECHKAASERVYRRLFGR